MGTTFKVTGCVVQFFAGLCLFTPLIASAALLTYRVDGLFFDLSSIGGSSNTLLTATFKIQSDAPDQDPYFARGFFTATPLSFNLEGDVLSSPNAAVVAIDQTTTDQYTVTSNWGGYNASGDLLGTAYANATIYLEFYDSSGTLYLSGPKTPLLSRDQLLAIDSATAIIDLPGNPGLSATGSVQINQVPIPPTTALVIGCFPLLASFRQHRRRQRNRIEV